MSFLRIITTGLRSLLRKEQVDRELDEELGAYLEMEAAEIGAAVRAELSKTKNKATKQSQPANKLTTAKSPHGKRPK